MAKVTLIDERTANFPRQLATSQAQAARSRRCLHTVGGAKPRFCINLIGHLPYSRRAEWVDV
jgi:hypothetical protein